jgi:hypothetical protein
MGCTRDQTFCRLCGKPLVQPVTGRLRVYCNRECKREYEREHKTLFAHTCIYCGKPFTSPNKGEKTKFCCHQCYLRYRFYHDEDIESVVQALREGRTPDEVPYWIIKLLFGKRVKAIVWDNGDHSE